jgi:hypothetical protein
MKKLKFFLCSIFFFGPFTYGQIFFSEYSEGSSYNKYLEIYNYSNETVNLYPQFVLTSCTNGCIDGNNFYINEFPPGASIAPGDVYVVAANQADEAILSESDYTFQYCCGNGDDAYALMLSGATGDVFDSSNALDIIGNEDTWQEGVGWDVAGVEQATENHTLVRKSSVMEHNAGDWSMSAGTNSDNSEWIVLDIDDWTNLGYHVYDVGTIIYGCTDPSAVNFNPNANSDDGSCEYVNIDTSGCYWCEYAANYFDFNFQITSSNMSIAITDISNLIEGDVIGAFFVDYDGYIKCGGSTIFEGNPIAISAWGDDLSTFMKDGFSLGDSFIFLIERNGVVYETITTLNNMSPFTNVFGNNNFGQVSELSVEEEFVEECVLPLGITEDCEQFFSISENKSPKKLVTEIDLFGRVLFSNQNSLTIRIYDDGSVDKNYFLNH